MTRHVFQCLDGHACGNPVRLITGPLPFLAGDTMSEKRADFMARFDWIRRSLMFEPRGHDMMSGAMFYPPCSDDADASILFIETSGCLPMCGHGTIGALTMALENGVFTPADRTCVKLDAPAGRIEAEIDWQGAHVTGVRIRNIASYLAVTGLMLDIPGWQAITVDIAYGGNFYAIIEPQPGYADLDEMSVADILRLSPLVRAAANEAVTLSHPDDARVQGVSHALWTGRPRDPKAHARNAVFYGARAIDRSPCGTGTSARMAQLAARGELKPGDAFIHESLIGSLFEGKVEAATTVGDHAAIIPSIKGWAIQTGINTIWVDERDPYAGGFTVG
ncbi:hydroxyproline-2-epimerase [Maricaulis sp. W15]|uniref:4-hydroxyproline epimerase n=1 Tax=Maricaulis sp. W15 TaxID=1772333 RepID=UPI000948D10F|nr:4-hydroxyproline epimerase [Maricaulis sp. W15]OLF81140.1 hydroxyproline-2-epimerase [Maricaulis sp. W15]